MARTSSSAVQAILGPNYDAEAATDVSPFIATATAVVDRISSEASGRGLTIDSTMLEIIERWLAAHYYGISDQFYSSRSTDGASGSFQGQTQMGFDATLYGQQAKRLDWTGTLAAMDSNAGVPQMVWLGKPPSTQLAYEDRD